MANPDYAGMTLTGPWAFLTEREKTAEEIEADKYFDKLYCSPLCNGCSACKWGKKWGRS